MKKALLKLTASILALFITFSYHSQISSFPYVQDFESFSLCGGQCYSTCALQDSWTNGSAALRDFSVNSGGTSSSSTGPTFDYNPGNINGKYLYAETSNPCYTGSNSWHLLSPTLDLTGSNDIQFTFWYHMYGSSMGNAHVDVSEDGGTTWALDIVPSWTDNQDIWQEKVISLGSFTGVVTVRIRYENPTGFYGDFAIDNVVIFDLLPNDAGISSFVNPNSPTCTLNDSVSVELTNYGSDTLTSVNINWSWNETLQTPYSWSGSLPPGQSDSISLGLVNYVSGDDLSSWTDMPNGISENPTGAGNDSSSMVVPQLGLNGTYSIGASGDYANFTNAVSDLNLRGVCGPVIFEVQDGNYNEQIVLNSVSGMDSSNTVTFKGQSQDTALAKLTFEATSTNANYVVAFNAADYYRIEYLTIENTGTGTGRVLDFQGDSDWNIISECYLVNSNTTTTSTNKSIIYSSSDNNNNNCHFIGNVIEGGSYGIYWYGTNGSVLSEGIIFEDNVLLNNYFRASQFNYTKDIKFRKNVSFENNSGYTGSRRANYFSQCDGSFEITTNRIYSTGPGGWTYGIYLAGCDGSISNRGLIANNMIQVGKPASTSSSYGIYSDNSGFMDIYGNNVLVTEGGSNSSAYRVFGGGATMVQNNNFTNYTTGYGVYLSNTFSVSEMDYNNIYSPNGNIGYFNETQLTLADWKTSTGFDNNGVSVNPYYHSNTDLHVCSDSLDQIGVNHPKVSVDYDGQLRGTNPDIGADEYSNLTSEFLGEDLSICIGDSVLLSCGSPSDTILWSTSDTTMSIWVQSGTFNVSINGVCGSGSDSIVIDAGTDVYANFIESDSNWLCTGDSIVLNSNITADSYIWNDNSTEDSLQVTSGGTYILNVSDACGSGSDTVSILEYSLPNVDFTYYSSFITGTFTNNSSSTGTTTYNWDFGDGTTSSESNPIHVFENVGPFIVTLTATNECGSSAFSDTVYLSTVELDEIFLNSEFAVFPNPSIGDFTIELTLLKNVNISVEVQNILGSIVYKSQEHQVDGKYSENISLKNAPSGVYFVRVTAEDRDLIQKIIIN